MNPCHHLILRPNQEAERPGLKPKGRLISRSAFAGLGHVNLELQAKAGSSDYDTSTIQNIQFVLAPPLYRVESAATFEHEKQWSVLLPLTPI